MGKLYSKINEQTTSESSLPFDLDIVQEKRIRHLNHFGHYVKSTTWQNEHLIKNT